MSVNLDARAIDQRIADHARRGEPAGAWAAPRHTLIFYGGYQEAGEGRLEMQAGHCMTMTDRKYNRVRTSGRAYHALKGHFSAPSVSHPMDPAMSNSIDHEAVRKGLEHVRSGFDPRGRLVLYGFSAGGFNALRLAERIGRWAGWYDFQTRQLTGAPRQTSATQQRFARVRIDLLITIDPCLQDLVRCKDCSRSTPRPPVQRHVNYYQDRDEYRGCQMSGPDNPHQWVSWNSHDLMPVLTVRQAERAIEDCLETALVHRGGEPWNS